MPETYEQVIKYVIQVDDSQVERVMLQGQQKFNQKSKSQTQEVRPRSKEPVARPDRPTSSAPKSSIGQSAAQSTRINRSLALQFGDVMSQRLGERLGPLGVLLGQGFEGYLYRASRRASILGRILHMPTGSLLGAAVGSAAIAKLAAQAIPDVRPMPLARPPLPPGVGVADIIQKASEKVQQVASMTGKAPFDPVAAPRLIPFKPIASPVRPFTRPAGPGTNTAADADLAQDILGKTQAVAEETVNQRFLRVIGLGKSLLPKLGNLGAGLAPEIVPEAVGSAKFASGVGEPYGPQAAIGGSGAKPPGSGLKGLLGGADDAGDPDKPAGDVRKGMFSRLFDAMGPVVRMFHRLADPMAKFLRRLLSPVVSGAARMMGDMGRPIGRWVQKMAPGITERMGLTGEKGAGIIGGVAIVGGAIAAIGLFTKSMNGLVSQFSRWTPAMSASIAHFQIMSRMLNMQIGQTLLPMMKAWVSFKESLLQMVDSLMGLLSPLVEIITPVIDILRAVVNVLKPVLKIIGSLGYMVGGVIKLALTPLMIVLKAVTSGLGFLLKGIDFLLMGLYRGIGGLLHFVDKITLGMFGLGKLANAADKAADALDPTKGLAAKVLAWQKAFIAMPAFGPQGVRGIPAHINMAGTVGGGRVHVQHFQEGGKVQAVAGFNRPDQHVPAWVLPGELVLKPGEAAALAKLPAMLSDDQFRALHPGLKKYADRAAGAAREHEDSLFRGTFGGSNWTPAQPPSHPSVLSSNLGPSFGTDDSLPRRGAEPAYDSPEGKYWKKLHNKILKAQVEFKLHPDQSRFSILQSAVKKFNDETESKLPMPKMLASASPKAPTIVPKTALPVVPATARKATADPKFPWPGVAAANRMPLAQWRQYMKAADAKKTTIYMMDGKEWRRTQTPAWRPAMGEGATRFRSWDIDNPHKYSPMGVHDSTLGRYITGGSFTSGRGVDFGTRDEHAERGQHLRDLAEAQGGNVNFRDQDWKPNPIISRMNPSGNAFIKPGPIFDYKSDRRPQNDDEKETADDARAFRYFQGTRSEFMENLTGDRQGRLAEFLKKQSLIPKYEPGTATITNRFGERETEHFAIPKIIGSPNIGDPTKDKFEVKKLMGDWTQVGGHVSTPMPRPQTPAVSGSARSASNRPDPEQWASTGRVGPSGSVQQRDAMAGHERYTPQPMPRPDFSGFKMSITNNINQNIESRKSIDDAVFQIREALITPLDQARQETMLLASVMEAHVATRLM